MEPSLFNEMNLLRRADLSPHLRLGTCSWKYDSWKGLIYDPSKSYSPNDYLTDYAKHFSTVEIDEWFWSLFPTGIKLPNPETVKIYADSVPEDFLFTVKSPNSVTLTHYYAKQPAKYQQIANLPNPNFLNKDLFYRFLELLHPMSTKLGPIIFQFEYLNKQKMPSLNQLLDDLSGFFSSAPKEFEYALELRNPNYFTEDLNQFFKEQSLSPVLIDGYYMPPLEEVAEKIDISAGKSLIIRLQGPDRQEIEKQAGNKWDRIISPQDAGLDTVAGIVIRHIKKGKKVIVNVNNHYEGCAPLTIKKIAEKIQG